MNMSTNKTTETTNNRGSRGSRGRVQANRESPSERPNLPEKKFHLRSPKKKSHRVQFVDPVVPEYLDQEDEAE